ncbi:hypothetical protein [Roseibium sp.]|uniref:hypothetical protein n=1 Tax=Roseibium sp. TaxID=1936156 RepID=UPI0032635A1B
MTTATSSLRVECEPASCPDPVLVCSRDEAARVYDGLLDCMWAAYPDGPPLDTDATVRSEEPITRLGSPELHLLKLLVYGQAIVGGYLRPDGAGEARQIARAAGVRPDQISALFDHRSPGSDCVQRLLTFVGVTEGTFQACAFRSQLADEAMAAASVREGEYEAALRAAVAEKTTQLCPLGRADALVQGGAS